MIPSFSTWAETIHAWHDGMHFLPATENELPAAVKLCVGWLQHHPMLPPVCSIDTSSKAIN